MNTQDYIEAAQDELVRLINLPEGACLREAQSCGYKALDALKEVLAARDSLDERIRRHLDLLTPEICCAVCMAWDTNDKLGDDWDLRRCGHLEGYTKPDFYCAGFWLDEKNGAG